MAESDTHPQADLRLWRETRTAPGLHPIPESMLQQVLLASGNYTIYPLAYYVVTTGTYDTATGKAVVRLNVGDVYWTSALSPRQNTRTCLNNQQALINAVEAFRQPLGENTEFRLTASLPEYKFRFEWTPEPSPGGLYTDFCCHTPEDLQRFSPGTLMYLACPQPPYREEVRSAVLLTILRVTAIDTNQIVGVCQTYNRRQSITVGIPFLKTLINCGGLVVGCQIPRRRGQATYTQGLLWAKGKLWQKRARNPRSRSTSAFRVEYQMTRLNPRNVMEFGEFGPQTPLLEPVEPGLVIRP